MRPIGVNGRPLSLLLVCGVLLGGCASPSGSTGAPAPSASSGAPAPAASPAGSASDLPLPSPGACVAAVTVDETRTGGTVCVLTGGTVTVRLAPPWGAPQPEDPTVLEPADRTAVSASFTARRAGVTRLTATQPACPSPEPGRLACHALRAFSVTVQVH